LVNLKTPESEKAFDYLLESGVAFVSKAYGVEAILFNTTDRYNYLKPHMRVTFDYNPALYQLIADKTIEKKKLPIPLQKNLPATKEINLVEGYFDSIGNHMIHGLLMNCHKYEFCHPLKNERAAFNLIEQNECPEDDRNSVHYKAAALDSFVGLIKEAIDQEKKYPDFSEKLVELSKASHLVVEAYQGLAHSLKPMLKIAI
jgi:hypothetical protein